MISISQLLDVKSQCERIDSFHHTTNCGGRMIKVQGQAASISPSCGVVPLKGPDGAECHQSSLLSSVRAQIFCIPYFAKKGAAASILGASVLALPSAANAACVTVGATLTCSGTIIGNTTDTFGGIGGLDAVVIDPGAVLDSSAANEPGLTLNSAGDGDLDITLGSGATITTTVGNESYNAGIEVYQTDSIGDLSFTNNGGSIDASAGLRNISTNLVSTNSTGNMSMIMNEGSLISDNSDGATRNSHGMRTLKVGGQGNSDIIMNGGSMDISGVFSHGIYSFYEEGAEGNSTVTMNGGAITTDNPTNDTFGNVGIEIRYDLGTGDAVANVGGTADIDTTGRGSHGVFITHRGLGGATATMSGGAISTDGLAAHGVNVSSNNGNFAGAANWGGATTITMSDGSIVTLGNESVGLRAISDWKSVTSDVQVTQSGGSIATSGDLSYGIHAQRRDFDAVGFIADGDISIAQGADGTINTGGATAHGIFADMEKVAGAIDIEVAGTIETAGNDAIGILATTRMLGADPNPDAITVTTTGGSITTSGANAHGISAQHFGVGDINVTSAGDITASGVDADGIFVLGDRGNNFSVQVNGGSIVSGSGLAAAIRTVSSIGGQVEILAGATVDASASGVAIRDGDADKDGVDETGGHIVVATAGTVTGDAILGLGNDVFNLAGGAYTGDIYGDDIMSSATDGADTFSWNGGILNGDFYGGNGSDAAFVYAGAIYDGTQTLDGGDGVAAADTWTDTLTFQGQTATAAASTILNWENVVIDGGSIGFADSMLVVGSDIGLGLSLTNGGVLIADGGFSLTGNLVNGGVISAQDGVVGSTVSVSGTYTGGGQLHVDADFSTDISDMLVVTGSVSGGPTTVSVTDVSAGIATGNDVLVVDVAGATSVGDFVLLGGPIASGAFDYDLELQGSQFFLAEQSGINATGASYDMAPAALSLFNRLPTFQQRVGSRSEAAEQPTWFRLYGDTSETTYSSRSTHDSDFAGIHFGADFDLDPGQYGRWTLGVSGQYGDLKSVISNAAGSGYIDTTGYGVGAAATWYGNSGSYVDAQAQVNWLGSDISSSTAGLLVSNHSSTAYAFSLEAGHRFDLKGNQAVVPQAQIIVGRIDGGVFTDSVGNAVDLHQNTSSVGRLGVAYEFGGRDTRQGYVIGNLLHTLAGESSVSVAGTDLKTTAVSETWAEVGLGGSLRLDNQMEFYGEASFRTALDKTSADTDTGMGGTIGLRYAW